MLVAGIGRGCFDKVSDGLRYAAASGVPADSSSEERDGVTLNGRGSDIGADDRIAFGELERGSWDQ